MGRIMANMPAGDYICKGCGEQPIPLLLVTYPCIDDTALRVKIKGFHVHMAGDMQDLDLEFYVHRDKGLPAWHAVVNQLRYTIAKKEEEK